MHKKVFLYIAWSQSLLAMVGSLYFSEFMHLPPCVLCWYQRIAMYPLVLLLAIGILRKDKNVVSYALPLSIGGLIIATYHNLLYYKLLPESVQPCVVGISCTARQLEWFGFITIPLLSVSALAIITVALLLFKKANQ